MPKTIQLGMNKPIKIQLPDCYFHILLNMANLEGRDFDIDTYAREALMRSIIDELTDDEAVGGYWGKVLVKGWLEELKEDPFYKYMTSPAYGRKA